MPDSVATSRISSSFMIDLNLALSCTLVDRVTLTHKKGEEIEYHGCCANFSNGDRRDVSHGFMVALSEAYTQDCAAELCAGRALGVMAFARESAA